MQSDVEQELVNMKDPRIVTITVGSCILAQGVLLRFLDNGNAVIKVGQNEFHGKLVQPYTANQTELSQQSALG